MNEQLSLQLGGPPAGAVGPGDARPASTPEAAVAPDDDARRRIRHDTSSTLFVEAGAGAGKTTALVGRILTLVDDGVPIDSVAAITFTEKAAAELRQRLREQLDAPADGHGGAERRRAALDGLDHAPIGTLHAFARRLLFEFPVEAGLPPGFGVLDELESQLALDERWEDLQDELLDVADREIAPGLPATEFVQLCAWGKFGELRGVRRIVEDFQSNWDLVEARVDQHLPGRPSLDVDAVVAMARALATTPAPPGDRQAALLALIGELAERLVELSTPRRSSEATVGPLLATIEGIVECAGKPARVGNKQNWRPFGGAEALDRLRADEVTLAGAAAACLGPWREYRRLLVGAIAARFVLDGARQRAAAGTLEFHDLLVLARRMLAHDGRARAVLHHRYQRVLLDEFQDTDPIQLEIALRLTASPVGQPTDASELRPLPGRLFVVGDPKQSIYRFRRADIGVYLAAAEQLHADRTVLSANFRSSAAVIDWVNCVFGQVISPVPGVQAAYGPLDVARVGRRDHGTVTVLGAEVHDDDDIDVNAQLLRERESSEVAAAVATALHDGWLVGDGDDELRPCRPGDIAVLLPARTSLPLLERALARLAVPYRAENASVVYVTPEIRHIMLTLRAAADPTDELALVAALRTPLYGCSDVELYDWKMAGGRWNPFAATPEDAGAHPVAEALHHVGSIAERIGRCGPAELLAAIVEERRVLETALAAADTRDVWRRVRYVVDQARAWTDAGGRGLRRYLRWAAYQASDGRANDTILPERDHDAVRIMTVHAAKGLEFAITVVAGLTTLMQGVRSMSVVWPEGTWTLAERDNSLFEAFKPLDEQMGDAERRRLLYVACTRAVDHLVVSLHRKPEKFDSDGGTSKATSATVLAVAGAAGSGTRRIDHHASVLPRPPADRLELPWADESSWAHERARAIGQASVRTATSATRLAADAPAIRPVAGSSPGAGAPPLSLAPWRLDAGLAKDAVDLDLPPWQRGRYGTAVGRAVHAVLQDADFSQPWTTTANDRPSGSTVADLESLAAAQCAAEGIFGFEPHVVALCRSALGTPIVQAVAAGAEHWRELFVVAEFATTVLEGYVDLLVRTPEGLVIVDYKTDRWPDGVDQTSRIGRYRLQLAAYGVALGRILDEPVVGGLLVRCRTDAVADQIVIDGWADACAHVEALARAGVADRSGPISAP